MKQAEDRGNPKSVQFEELRN